MKKLTACYARVSTQEQVKEGYSIDEQIERLRSYCEAMGWNRYKIYVEAGASGGNMNRPALQEMLKDIRSGMIEKVVVYKLDRLSRSQKDTLNLIEDEFLAHGVDFISMSENFDTSSPFGRAMVGILAVFAQLEREQIKERMSMGREARAKEGKWVGVGNSPVGYDYIDGALQINDFEAVQIRELFELYNSGSSPRQIARIFNDKGYKTKYGKWYERRIVTTLQNKLYAGYVSFDGEYYQGIHDAIISAETYEITQKNIEARKRSDLPAAPQSTYLGGLLFCKNCGARYGIYGSGKYRYYACHSRRKRNAAMIKDPNCKNKTYRVDVLDELIFSEIRKLELDPELISSLRNHSDESEKLEHDSKRQAILSQMNVINRQRRRYLELYGLDTFSPEELQDMIEPLTEQAEKLQEELDRMDKNQPVISDRHAQAIVNGFSDILKRGRYEEIRAVIEALIQKIVIEGDDIEIYWRFC